MKADPQKGKRYLLELVVQDLTDGKIYLLAEYVFLPNGKDASLCYPSGLQWDKKADVFLILTAKNLGRWVHHFIKNVEKIVQETKDDHLHVVIYDFGSPDIDIEQAFQRSTLKNYHFVIKPGRYSRTNSFSEAIKSINNSDAIVVTIDLHLDIGSQTINDIRKVSSLSIGRLSKRRFWATRVNSKWTFWNFGPWFWTNFLADRLYKSKDTQQYKLGSTQTYLKGKGLTSGWLASSKNVVA